MLNVKNKNKNTCTQMYFQSFSRDLVPDYDFRGQEETQKDLLHWLKTGIHIHVKC